MITIIDYGVGNILAFSNAYNRLNIPVTIARNAEELKSATKLILPGVGSFDNAMRKLEQSGMKQAVERLVLEQKIPVLGICVGMQMLANSSDEGELPGLGWIDGTVKKFDATMLTADTILPHMGWNNVKHLVDDGLFKGMEQEAKFYFLHSYYFKSSQSESVLAQTDYGKDFDCAVQRGNIYGVQFHPEKSHHFGSQLLKNFAEL